MEKQGDEIHVDDIEASAGETSGHMRWVLGIGLFLAIAILSVIWISGALTQGDVEEEATATGIVASTAEEGDSTDSIVSDRLDEMDTAQDVEVAPATEE